MGVPTSLVVGGAAVQPVEPFPGRLVPAFGEEVHRKGFRQGFEVRHRPRQGDGVVRPNGGRSVNTPKEDSEPTAALDDFLADEGGDDPHEDAADVLPEQEEEEDREADEEEHDAGDDLRVQVDVGRRLLRIR